MNNLLEVFTQAIRDKRKVRLTFFSKEDGHALVRTCAPLDFGPSRRARDKSDRFHLWDYDSDTRNHVLSLPPHQVMNLEILDETFDPADLVTWDIASHPWFFARDWGEYS